MGAVYNQLLPGQFVPGQFFEAYSILWKSLAALEQGPETDAKIRSFFQRHGIQAVTWKDRLLAPHNGKDRDEVRVNKIFLTDEYSRAVLDDLGAAHKSSPLTPPYEDDTSFSGTALRMGQPYAYSQLPRDERPFLEFLYSENANVAGIVNQDSVCVPLPVSDPNKIISTINFALGRKVREREMGVFVQLASLLSSLWRRPDRANDDSHPKMSPPKPKFRDKEMETLKWAIAGKTMEEISIITAIPVRSIRYYLYKIRDHYGYATVQQTLVRVAKDFGIDP
ncbi:helix-turn-helix transcriptional regulator [Aestuariispira insulae]|uniref:DNA-binding CsgD family transcriptional regulator n=1 Tax=Aestuariispira insulae TaxID=1461337 RepID=A0A3D9HRJ4_9PROT|nr:hypothetical protein [Aestuariispira insulae]RED52079.1 DNA-binding CsgD family transcriptional regulator [Aestuariispira insulae]